MDGIAASTTGFTGADLANLINEAALLAGRSDKGASPLCFLLLALSSSSSSCLTPLSPSSSAAPSCPSLSAPDPCSPSPPAKVMLLSCCAFLWSVCQHTASTGVDVLLYLLVRLSHDVNHSHCSDLLDFMLQAQLDRQSLTRPFCALWQAWRKRGVCCRVQRRRAWQSMSVVMPLSAQLWRLSSQPLHRSLLAPDQHFVPTPRLLCAVLRAVLCCASLCCASLCCAALCCGGDPVQLCHQSQYPHRPLLLPVQ